MAEAYSSQNFVFKTLSMTMLFLLIGVLMGCPNTSTTISGHITHNSRMPFTHQGNFAFTENSHAIVTLYTTQGADSPRQKIKSIEIKNITGFPISFALHLDQPIDFNEQSSQQKYHLEATVFQESGSELQVGDLLSETIIPVSIPSTVIEVTGLESCSNSSSGGFCL